MRKVKPKFQNKTKQKKRDAILYRSFMTAIAVFVLYHIFIESHLFGSDYRYNLFVFWIPTLIGFFIALKFNLFQFDWKECISDIKKETNFFYKIFTIPFIILAHFVFAVIMFWMPSNIIWDALNKMESKNNKLEVFFIPVNQFSTSSKGADRIYFYFKNELESIPVPYQDIKPYLDKNPSNFKVEIDVRKGLWNHYVLESWDIR